MGKVKFIECTLEEYNSLETKDSDTLYFVSDRNIIYKGELPFPDSATSTKDGIMSADDKKFIDGINFGYLVSMQEIDHNTVEEPQSTYIHWSCDDSTEEAYCPAIKDGDHGTWFWSIGFGDGIDSTTSPNYVMSVSLSPATTSAIGGVKPGEGCEVTADGTLNITGSDTNIWKTARTPGEFYKATDNPTSTEVGKFDGYLYATRVYNAVWNDYAELFEKGEDIEFDHLAYVKQDGKVYSAGEPSNVVGIVTNNYGHLLGGDGDPNSEDYIPISLAGRVPIEVSEEINIGDMVAANKNGTCRKATKEDFGCIVGKCVGSDPKNRENYVLVLVGMR